MAFSSTVPPETASFATDVPLIVLPWMVGATSGSARRMPRSPPLIVLLAICVFCVAAAVPAMLMPVGLSVNVLPLISSVPLALSSASPALVLFSTTVSVMVWLPVEFAISIPLRELARMNESVSETLPVVVMVRLRVPPKDPAPP